MLCAITQVYVENPQQEEENSCPVEGVEEIVESVSGRKHRRKRGTVSDDVFITPDGYTMKRRRSRRSKKGKNDEDNDSTNKTIEIDVEEIDMSKVWKDDCSVEDIIRFQSRDGFWDLSSLFVSRKCKGKLPEISGNSRNRFFGVTNDQKKRVISTVFTLAKVKFNTENAGRWKFAKEKGIKWLKRMKSTINCEEIINGIISCIDK